LDPAKSRVFKIFFKISRPQKKKAQPGGGTASQPACAIGAIIGLHSQKRILKKNGFGLVAGLMIIGSGLWTYKRHQALPYSHLFHF
jgi:hypothetical protein